MILMLVCAVLIVFWRDPSCEKLYFGAAQVFVGRKFAEDDTALPCDVYDTFLGHMFASCDIRRFDAIERPSHQDEYWHHHLPCIWGVINLEILIALHEPSKNIPSLKSWKFYLGKSSRSANKFCDLGSKSFDMIFNNSDGHRREEIMALDTTVRIKRDRERIREIERQRLDVERFSDRQKTVFTRDSLSQVLEFKDFPKELTQGAARRMSKRKNFRWNPESDLKALDFFEQLEKKAQGQEDKGEKEKKEGENEEDDENAENEEGEEELSDDDYNQNEYFDDDEDDYNDVDDGEDEGVY
ncbi:uncharacterized protein LOC129299022 [Prosopis cineraria]|uniref:uncharacterized protein LOC129299022 n=1 Tax=Prosopis cineraria TaxID=364024 RepID=UPI0024103A6E|nr:uncharacterized protein LOC129299022 [Prosopis cineraria]